MSAKKISPKLQIRRDLSTNWTSKNPILLSGELGFETNTNKIKIGDGSSTWSALPYITDDYVLKTLKINGKALTSNLDLTPEDIEAAPVVHDHDDLYFTESEITSKLQGKVDVVSGKGLSTNDFTNDYKEQVDKNTNSRHDHSNKTILDNTSASYTTEEKTKLSGIAAGAEVNVQADWNVQTETSDAYIKNKPQIPSKISDLENDSDFLTEHQNISDRAKIDASNITDTGAWKTKLGYLTSVPDASTSAKGIIEVATDTEATAGSATNLAITPKQLKTGLATVEGKIPDVSDFITKDVNNLTNYTVSAGVGTSIELSIDTSTYVLTAKLKNADGDALGEAQTVDLPLETMVVDADYNSSTKEIVLTLENGNTTKFSVADLVSGLVPDTRKVAGKALSADITLASSDLTDGSSLAKKTDIPEIPTVGNGNVKIIQNDEEVGSFTLNQSGDVTIELTDTNTVYTHPASHPASMISGLASVATSGSYADLSDKPTIPTVNNGTLTIQKNGENVATFTANQSTSKTANIEVPTKLSELNADETHRTVTDAEKAVWNAKSNFSGSYSDLTGVPTIPTVGNGKITIKQAGSEKGSFTLNQGSDLTIELTDNDTKYTHPDTHPASMITGLASIATSGKYSDLSGAPTIPSVGNGTVTIKQNGSTKGSFTLNQTGNTTIELTDTDTITTIPTIGNGKVTIKQNGVEKGSFTMNQTGATTIELTDTDTDTNTTYSAGAGISLSGTTFSNAGVRSITQDSTDGHKLTINTGGTSKTITIPDNSVTYSTTAPSMDGIASVGTATTVARSDHTHPTDTSRAADGHTHTVTHTPTGTVSKPTITVTPTTASIKQITAVGTLPSLTATASNRRMTLTFSAGTLPTSASVTVATGIQSATSSQPTFTGTEATITTSVNSIVSNTYTITYDFNDSALTGEATYGYNAFIYDGVTYSDTGEITIPRGDTITLVSSSGYGSGTSHEFYANGVVVAGSGLDTSATSATYEYTPVGDVVITTTVSSSGGYAAAYLVDSGV